MDSQSDSYFRYYAAQHGGSLPVFRGSRHYQDGAGIGDILRGIFRFFAPVAVRGLKTIAPVAVRGLTSFAGNTMRAHEAGASLADAAKASIGPAFGDAMKVAFPQVGSGPAMSALVAKKQGYQTLHNEPFAQPAPIVRKGAIKRPHAKKQGGRGAYKKRRTGSQRGGSSKTSPKRKRAAPQKGAGRKKQKGAGRKKQSRKKQSGLSDTLTNF